MRRFGTRRGIFLKNNGPSYDPDAAAFFAVVTTLTPSQKTAVNNFVLGLKSDSLWTKFDRIYINVGTTIADHAVCLKTLTSRTGVNNPTWKARGTYYDGVSTYFRADIQVDQSTQMTANDGAAFFFWDPTDPPFANAMALMGSSNGTDYMALQWSSSS